MCLIKLDEPRLDEIGVVDDGEVGVLTVLPYCHVNQLTINQNEGNMKETYFSQVFIAAECLKL